MPRTDATIALLLLAGAIGACGGVKAGAASPRGPAPARPTGVLAGLVRDPLGHAIAFAALDATQSRGARAGGSPAQASDTTASDGSFHLVVPPGRYRVTASYARLGASLPDVVVLQGKTTRLLIDLRAGPRATASAGDEAAGEAGTATSTGAIAGRVTDTGDGRPFPGAVVAVASPVLRDAQMALSDSHGVYRVPGLPPGTYVVTVYYQLVDRGSIELRRTQVAVSAGHDTRVDLHIDLRVKR